MNKSTFQIPFRITVGVTGHRTLDNEKILRRTVQHVLDDILVKFKSSGGTPVKLCSLSPLAEGADRLVAAEVLKHEGASLKAVLPLAVEDYMADFKTEKSRREFKSLLRADPSPVLLRNKPLKSEFSSKLIVQARRLAYEEAGKFVADHCDVLIAVWDGRPGSSSVGTAGIVEYARRHKCPVYIISTSDPETFTFENGDGITDKLCSRIDRFNGLLDNTKKLAAYRDAVYKMLFDNPRRPEGRFVPENIKRITGSFLIPYYVASSVLSKRYQDIYRRVGLATFAMSFTALAIAAAAAVFGITSYAAIGVKFIIIALIIFIISFANRIHSHRKWMEYRFLAEKIRSGFFLAAAGAREKNMHFPRRGQNADERHWVLMAIEEIWNHLGPEVKPVLERDLQVTGNFIAGAWIDDQLEYHRKNRDKNNRLSRNCERAGLAVFIIAISVISLEIIILALGFCFNIHLPAGLNHPFESIAALLLILIPALGSTIEAVRSHRQYSRLALHNENMVYQLEKARDHFKLFTPERLQSMVYDMDTLVMNETEEWFNMMSFSRLHRSI